VPPVPVEDKLLIVLLRTVSPLLELPKTIPEIVLWPVILVIVLVEILLAAPPKLKDTRVILLVPPVILLKIFPVNVLAGASVAVLPSALTQPAIVVAPVTVIFEKLLLFAIFVEPFTEKDPDV